MLTTAAMAATLAFIVAGFAVGVRLLATAARTRGLPEITMSVALLLLVGVGYPIMLGARMLLAGDEPGAGAGLLFVLSSACMNAGWMAIWIFTWNVFRKDSPIAKGVAGLAILVHLGLLGSTILRVATEPVETLLEPRRTATVLLLMAMSAYGWTAFESLHSWRQMRRRLALGLADPVTTNRILLWAVVAIFSMLSIAAPTVSAIRGIDSGDDPVQRLLLAVTGTVCAGALFLAFLPPASYLRWVRGRAASAEA